jgi:hypothetical protein
MKYVQCDSHCSTQTDRQTDRQTDQTKLIVTLRNFAKAAKMFGKLRYSRRYGKQFVKKSINVLHETAASIFHT